MKKVLLIVLINMIALISNAQNNFFDEIDLTGAPLSPYWFSGPFGQGWTATHGAPLYSPTQIELWATSAFYSDNGVGYHQVSSGVSRPCYFQANTDYSISIGIPVLVNCSRFLVILANGVTNQSSKNGYMDLPPTFPSSRIIYDHYDHWDGTTNGSYGNRTNFTLNLKFTTGPSETWESIVIYPMPPVGTTQTGVRKMLISCLSVEGCANDQYYSNTIIPWGTSYQPNAYIGSSYGSSTTNTSTDPTRNTTIYAYDKINLSSNTVLSVNSGKVIQLGITSPICDEHFNLASGGVESSTSNYICMDNAKRQPPQSTVGNIYTIGQETQNLPKINEQEYNNVLSLSPVPANDILNIDFSLTQNTDVNVSIYDLYGRVFVSKDISSMSRGNHKVNLDVSKLSSGSYLVEFKTVEGIKTKQFVIAR